MKPQQVLSYLIHKITKHGGGKGIRTPDLLSARQALYQLSYTPNYYLNLKEHVHLPTASLSGKLNYTS